MAINLTLFPTEAPAVIYFEDGSTMTVDPQQEKSFQLPSGAFCTISSTAGSNEDDEHQPDGTALAEAMIAFWDRMREKFRIAAQQPTVNPVEVEVE